MVLSLNCFYSQHAKDLKHCFPTLYGRVPLIKGKSAREALEEKGLWEQYKKMYPFNPMAKYTQSYAVGYESMTNDADVNFSAPAVDKTMLRH